MSDTSTLKTLGQGMTAYASSVLEPMPILLETFENQHPYNFYLVPFIQDRDEFTSLCPKTGQPDHARMEIIYIPNEKLVESKSLKLYLVSFRQTGEFHEDVVNRIANDLWDLLEPKYLRVIGNFAPRGGLAIKPMVVKVEQNAVPTISWLRIEHLVTSWDNTK